jgi:PPOX class probable F420-dependent enzyme
MSVDLPDRFVELLKGPNPCFITTLMPDGSPQTTETWVDTDGEHVVINTVQTHQKLSNIQRDSRVSVAVCDAGDPSRYFAVRGRVTNLTTEGGAEHIELLAQRYTGGPYQWYGGRDQGRRLRLRSHFRAAGGGNRATQWTAGRLDALKGIGHLRERCNHSRRSGGASREAFW